MRRATWHIGTLAHFEKPEMLIQSQNRSRALQRKSSRCSANLGAVYAFDNPSKPFKASRGRRVSGPKPFDLGKIADER
jgi:hypothetical protein